RPVTGSGCVTITMCSVTPATDSRSHVKRGFGQRAADNTSTRATSTPARTARARGLSADNRANASDSVKAVDWAPTLAGMTAAASATQITALRIKPRMKLVWADDGRTRQIRSGEEDGRAT